MVKLRLRRMGANDQPFYRIVAIDSRVSRDGKYIESIGWYDPKPNPSKIQIEKDRALYWLGVGAQPSDTVRSLLRKAGILQIRHEQKIESRKAAENTQEVRNEGTD
ncbi:MAG TPA: 30S ribosomal protein S16 [Candidatus Cloacimonadota bacterium]|jgi:small subunit ribosomal protein S16|nr:30S ribosomal protein S16 [Candidatus Cloacimonadota bacterium]MDI9525151.1 30S ribosomal protein S16 [Candidatus Cloacimonadota bacterium]NLH93166.1 30S ribosomal protein S16 [Candidatus Cloacimonadota bacterium]OQB89815.1 MAG: 30S ribosomal protein S16 [Candidatus Cloacimonetes bacterium ADurb.Bin117]HOG31106.1 30S ribosomal protein S16 [Candidatus Cloacimonadota bacterium]